MCESAKCNETTVENNIEDEALDTFLVNDYEEQEPFKKEILT